MSHPDLDLSAVATLLCDADGTLFASEEPAFAASVAVTNSCLEQFGSPDRYTGEELRLVANGKSFRLTLTELAAANGVDVESAAFARDLERWVAEENVVVTRHLAAVLAPDASVRGPLDSLASDYQLAVVSSSALARVDASLQSSGLADLFPQQRRFSAQDSLPEPTSKPDPAVYHFAVRELGLQPGAALAIEDAVPGAQAAVAAGLPTVGMLCFVPAAERDQRVRDLEAVGVDLLINSWTELADLLRQAHDAAPRPANIRKDGVPA